ncbi:hypothetical protein Pd630_LPD07378 [Rhodococcus opacus PD630]|nr:hypothetical protein Pd630_LPD07378 [Rhodococcus opacus PD630]
MVCSAWEVRRDPGAGDAGTWTVGGRLLSQVDHVSTLTDIADEI